MVRKKDGSVSGSTRLYLPVCVVFDGFQELSLWLLTVLVIAKYQTDRLARLHTNPSVRSPFSLGANVASVLVVGPSSGVTLLEGEF